MSSPRELYGIFADNLRILTEGHRSVSELCRELGVNRTQFNRYLAGQASPRPEVLHRICQHFGVNARILLEPLHEIHDPGEIRVQPFRAIFDYLYSGRELLELRSPPPPGIHTYWQRSSLHEGWANSYTIRLFWSQGAMMFRALENPGRDGHRDSRRNLQKDVRGWLMDQDDGIVMQAFQPAGKRLSFGFLSYPPLSDSVVYPGVVMISRPVSRQVTRLENCALEVLPQGQHLRPRLKERSGRWIRELSSELQACLSGEVS